MPNCVNCSKLAKLLIELANESSKNGLDLHFYAVEIDVNRHGAEIKKYKMAFEDNGNMLFPQLIAYKKGERHGIVVGFGVLEIKDMLGDVVPQHEVYENVFQMFNAGVSEGAVDEPSIRGDMKGVSCADYVEQD